MIAHRRGTTGSQPVVGRGELSGAGIATPSAIEHTAGRRDVSRPPARSASNEPQRQQEPHPQRLNAIIAVGQ